MVLRVTTGNPRVAYRETIHSVPISIIPTKKQNRGSGQSPALPVLLNRSVMPILFLKIKYSAVPFLHNLFLLAKKDLNKVWPKGRNWNFRLRVWKWLINDGASMRWILRIWLSRHALAVHSRTRIWRAKPVIHEPIMKVVVETPTGIFKPCNGTFNQRRAWLSALKMKMFMVRVIESQVPLAGNVDFRLFCVQPRKAKRSSRWNCHFRQCTVNRGEDYSGSGWNKKSPRNRFKNVTNSSSLNGKIMYSLTYKDIVMIKKKNDLP